MKMKKLNKTINEIIEKLEEIDNWYREYFEYHRTIDHGLYAWNNSYWKLDKKNKVLYVKCSGESPFTREEYFNEEEYETKDGWKVILETRHSDLDCPGYCEIFKR